MFGRRSRSSLAMVDDVCTRRREIKIERVRERQRDRERERESVCAR